MVMERRATTIMLMLWLAALLLVGTTVADDIIRLPGVTDERKPCCKTPACTKRKLCYCADLFEDKECGGAGTCRNCKAVKFQGSDPVLYICRDAVWGGGPLPDCKDAGN